jgi:hypothetical protein
MFPLCQPGPIAGCNASRLRPTENQLKPSPTLGTQLLNDMRAHRRAMQLLQCRNLSSQKPRLRPTKTAARETKRRKLKNLREIAGWTELCHWGQDEQPSMRSPTGLHGTPRFPVYIVN